MLPRQSQVEQHEAHNKFPEKGLIGAATGIACLARTDQLSSQVLQVLR
jgi:hypothetical protein